MAATTRMTISAAILAVAGSVLWAAPGSGSAGSEAVPSPASRSGRLDPAQSPRPLDPPGCWDTDEIWHPDCWGPGQWGPGMGPGMMGPGMMGPGGQWGPGMGPGMMGPGPWAD
ncbi:hypothetical protein H7J51_13415 [Mycobacterium crocinum]|uniref:Uncharacterized protein n=1 Tax=Mycolicibacterium crocinum TaxID=388459 RepID=A0ABY3TPX2_9MYCO|nr:hypothetical protein [Mycolicibacterium crocinum]MCV7216278.1 hypothetical protein [Mycolicibacterium crocinum]ULN41195.1 hypothetical protein MI149_26960 [Mycolicibacterium crocinum]